MMLPRLQQVIDGEQGGISKALNWQGDGGFRFMTPGARSQGFLELMYGRTDAQLTHDAAWTFEFQKGRYPVRQAYNGRWDFRKHYYPQIAKLKSEGEEFECAKALEQNRPDWQQPALPHVPRICFLEVLAGQGDSALDRESAVKHWARNLEQLPEFAFWPSTIFTRTLWPSLMMGGCGWSNTRAMATRPTTIHATSAWSATVGSKPRGSAL
ncbi:MAG: hypothetical protein ABJA84_09010 [Polaromonas sp.]